MFKLPRSLTLFPRRKRNKGSNYDDDGDTSPVDKIDSPFPWSNISMCE